MYRNTRYILLILLSSLACCLVSSCKDDEEPDALSPMQQAEAYYNMLVSGDYEGFVLGTYGTNSIPEPYLKERIDLLAQHVKAEQSRRGGYIRFSALGDSVLSDSLHLVYLDVLFGDSTHETIACPLLQHKGRWMMRN